jgi:hypothetical protein
LQRVGVLELVQQDVLVARIQAGLQVGGAGLVVEQAVGLPFEVGEVQHALLGFHL